MYLYVYTCMDVEYTCVEFDVYSTVHKYMHVQDGPILVTNGVIALFTSGRGPLCMYIPSSKNKSPIEPYNL